VHTLLQALADVAIDAYGLRQVWLFIQAAMAQ